MGTSGDFRLRLPAQTQKDDVVARENRVDDLWKNSFVEPNDARKDRCAVAQFSKQILSQLDPNTLGYAGLSIELT